MKAKVRNKETREANSAPVASFGSSLWEIRGFKCEAVLLAPVWEGFTVSLEAAQETLHKALLSLPPPLEIT
jgi:hypothetical protein